MLRCNQCGAQVSDGSTFCPRCGNPIASGAPMVPAGPQPPYPGPYARPMGYGRPMAYGRPTAGTPDNRPPMPYGGMPYGPYFNPYAAYFGRMPYPNPYFGAYAQPAPAPYGAPMPAANVPTTPYLPAPNPPMPYAGLHEIEEDPAAAVSHETVDTYPSRFTGGAFANFFIGLISTIISILSLGLLAPAMICWQNRWECKHTFIQGRKLDFDGTGLQLFGRWLLWMLLSIVTLGIFALFCLPVASEKWVVKHTHFRDNGQPQEGASYFDGKSIQFLGVCIVSFLLTLITLGIGIYWAVTYINRWYKKHTVIDGCRLYFDGHGIQYLGKCICWTLLTIITLGIYSFWLVVKSRRWIVKHTHTYDLAKLPFMSQNAALAARETNEPTGSLSIASFVISLLAVLLLAATATLIVVTRGFSQEAAMDWKIIKLAAAGMSAGLAVISLAVAAAAVGSKGPKKGLAVAALVLAIVAIAAVLAYGIVLMLILSGGMPLSALGEFCYLFVWA